MMYEGEKNEYGCSLHNQSGAMAVRDFDAIVEHLPPDLRAAFNAERTARRAELESFLAACAAPKGLASMRHSLLRRVGALALARRAWLAQVPRQARQFEFLKRIARFIPRIAAHLAVSRNLAVAYSRPAWSVLRATMLHKSM